MSDYLLDRPAEGKYALDYQKIPKRRIGQDYSVTIFDTVNGEFVKEEFGFACDPTPASYDEENRRSHMANLELMLRLRPADSRARVIWVEYSGALNFGVQEMLGTIYSLPPAFFRDHSGKPEYDLAVPPLPSQHIFFQIEIDSLERYLSAVFYREVAVGSEAKITTSR
jgi:hypothetical protein